jgi:hypothetical protein
MNEVPAAVYKYLTADRTATILGSLQVRFSQASVLNDATELKPSFKGIATESDLKRVLTERVRRDYPDVVERVEQSLPSGLATQLIDEVMAQAAARAEANLAQSTQKLYDALDKNFGILSLSETPTNSLLWGYYGDGGYGFLIHFDPSHEWFWAKREDRDDFRHLRRVIYVSERLPKYVMEINGNDALYSKGIEWEHEKEWRIIRSFREAAVKLGPDQYGKDVLLFNIPPACIQSVVIGYRAKPEAVQKIREIVSQNPVLAHVQFERALLTGSAITIAPEKSDK